MGNFITYDSLEPKNRDVVGLRKGLELVSGKTSEFSLCFYLCLLCTFVSFYFPGLSSSFISLQMRFFLITYLHGGIW